MTSKWMNFIHSCGNDWFNDGWWNGVNNDWMEAFNQWTEWVNGWQPFLILPSNSNNLLNNHWCEMKWIHQIISCINLCFSEWISWQAAIVLIKTIKRQWNHSRGFHEPLIARAMNGEWVMASAILQSMALNLLFKQLAVLS